MAEPKNDGRERIDAALKAADDRRVAEVKTYLAQALDRDGYPVGNTGDAADKTEG